MWPRSPKGRRPRCTFSGRSLILLPSTGSSPPASSRCGPACRTRREEAFDLMPGRARASRRFFITDGIGGTGGSGGPGFTPPQTGNLQGWWWANSGTYQDTALSTPATADNTAVGGVSPLLGAVPLTQATGANRPLLKLAQINGRSTLLFNKASTQFLSANALAASVSGTDRPQTWIAVVRFV